MYTSPVHAPHHFPSACVDRIREQRLLPACSPRLLTALLWLAAVSQSLSTRAIAMTECCMLHAAPCYQGDVPVQLVSSLPGSQL
jgi:hypothetical protein